MHNLKIRLLNWRPQIPQQVAPSSRALRLVRKAVFGRALGIACSACAGRVGDDGGVAEGGLEVEVDVYGREGGAGAVGEVGDGVRSWCAGCVLTRCKMGGCRRGEYESREKEGCWGEGEHFVWSVDYIWISGRSGNGLESALVSRPSMREVVEALVCCSCCWHSSHSTKASTSSLYTSPYSQGERMRDLSCARCNRLLAAEPQLQ